MQYVTEVEFKLGLHRGKLISSKDWFRQEFRHGLVHPFQGLRGEAIRRVVPGRVGVGVSLPHLLRFRVGAVKAHKGSQVHQIARFSLYIIGKHRTDSRGRATWWLYLYFLWDEIRNMQYRLGKFVASSYM